MPAAQRGARRAPRLEPLPVIEPIAHKIGEVAAANDCSNTAIRNRFLYRTLAYLPVGDGALRIVRGDETVILGEMPSPATDGRHTIRTAFPGRVEVTTIEVACALAVHRRTIERAIERGEMPASRETGRWLFNVAELKAWLLKKRVPTRWEGGDS